MRYRIVALKDNWTVCTCLVGIHFVNGALVVCRSLTVVVMEGDSWRVMLMVDGRKNHKKFDKGNHCYRMNIQPSRTGVEGSCGAQPLALDRM